MQFARTTLFLLACFVSVSKSAARELNDRYTFTTRACEEGIYFESGSHSSGQRFIRNLSTTTCDRSLGVRQEETSEYQGAGIKSENTAWEMMTNSMSQKNGISIELWLKPGIDPKHNEKRPILTIGLPDTGKPPTVGYTPCDAESFDFQLYQRNGYIEVAYRTSDSGIEPCQIFRAIQLQLPPLEPKELAHIVVSLTDRHQQVFVNGQPSPILMNPFSNDLQHWHADWEMKLFGYEYPAPLLWEGSIYQLAFYPGALSTQDVKTLMVDWVPSARPYSFDTSLVVNEDAEDVAESHPVEWYRHEGRIEDLERIQLPYKSFNTVDVQRFRNRLNIARSKSLPPVFFYVTSLPKIGRLYQTNGIRLEAVDLISGGFISVNSADGELIFRPPLHNNSETFEGTDPLAGFTFCVSDADVFDAQHCKPSRATITVRSVNDPPIANRFLSPITLKEGNVSMKLPKILLSGTDVDVGDSIRRVQISLQPSHGHLHLNVGSFRKDGLRHGKPLAELNYTVSAQDPVYVYYVWDFDSNNASVVRDQDAAKDWFRYRVQDQHGRWSAEEQVDILILPSLTAAFDHTVVIGEDSRKEGNIKWFGHDESGYRRRVGFLVESVPSVDKGIFLESVSRKPVVAGSRLDAFDRHPYSAGVALTFWPSRDFCIINRANEPDPAPLSVAFRVVAFAHSDDRVVSVSEVFKQNITVDCALDAISLKVPNEPFIFKEFTLRGAASDPCRGSVFNLTTLETFDCAAAAVINGIEVTSRDVRTQKATVTVLPGSGYVTFNKAAWSSVEQVVGRRAVASTNVTFLAYPENLTSIFADLHFQSYVPGADAIDIFILYGDCATVNTSKPLPSLSIPSCQVVAASIKVYVEADENKYHSESKLLKGDFPWQIVFCLLGYPIIYYAFVRLEILIEGGANDKALPPWIQHKTKDGDFYYENTADGSVTWMAPVGEDFLPWQDEQEDR